MPTRASHVNGTLFSVPWYPAIMPAAVMIQTYATLSLSVPIFTMVRPTLIATAASVAIALLVAPLAGRHVAALVSLVVSIGLVDLDVKPAMLATAIAVGIPLLIAALMAWVGARRPTDPRPQVTRYLNVVTLLMLMLALVRWAGVGGPGQLVADIQPEAVAAASRASGPNMYVVLTDAYPRADVLLEQFAHDNTPFLESLASLGFDSYSGARSDYHSTTLTLASMLNMARLEDLGLPIPSRLERPPQPDYRNALRSPRAFEVLRGHGYEVVTIEAGWDEVTLWGADRIVPTGTLNHFEHSVIAQATIGPLVRLAAPSFFGDEKRNRVEEGLGALRASAAEPPGRARFVFAHIPAPHYPLVYEADGSALDVDIAHFDQFDRDDPMLSERYAGNLEHLNQLLLDSITSVVAADPSAVIVLMSDHGSLLDAGGAEERLKTLMAARTPDQPMLLGASPTPVELLRTLFRTYLGSDVAIGSAERP